MIKNILIFIVLIILLVLVSLYITNVHSNNKINLNQHNHKYYGGDDGTLFDELSLLEINDIIYFIRKYTLFIRN